MHTHHLYAKSGSHGHDHMVVGFTTTYAITNIAVIPKVRRTVTKVRLKLSWTDKIILIVGLIDQLTYFIFGKFSNNCQIKIFGQIALIVNSA
jgi:hypothetical protein